MKKNLFKLGLLLVMGALMVACAPDSKDQPTEPMVKDGTFTNFTASRDTVMRFQPILFTGDYTPSKNITKENISYAFKLTIDGKEAQLPKGTPKVDNDIMGLRFVVDDCYVGDCVLNFTITEKLGDDSNQLSSSVKFTVIEGKPQIRNSNWKSCRTDCRLDISYYGDPLVAEIDQLAGPSMLNFTEQDDYLQTWSENPQVIPFEGFKREVSYRLGNDQLAEIEYNILPPNENTDLIAALMQRITALEGAYYDLHDPSFLVEDSQANLSKEERALADQFAAGTLQADDANQTLSKAILREPHLELNALVENANTQASLWLYKEGNKLTLKVVFMDYDLSEERRCKSLFSF